MTCANYVCSAAAFDTLQTVIFPLLGKALGYFTEDLNLNPNENGLGQSFLKLRPS